MCTLTLSVLTGTKTSFSFFHLHNVSSIFTPSYCWICKYTRKEWNSIAFSVGGSRSGWSPFFKVVTIFMYLCFLICASKTSRFSSPKKLRLILNLWQSLSAWFWCTYISINQYMYSILCSIWLLVQKFFQILDHIKTKVLLFCTYHTYS